MTNPSSLYRIAALSSALVFASGLVACGDNNQAEQSSLSSQQANAAMVSDYVKQASDSAAHWLTPELLVLPKSQTKLLYQLVNANSDAFDAITLMATDLPQHLAKKFPHLADFQAYKVNLSANQAKDWLKQQLMVVGLDKAQQSQQVSWLQTGAVIDALYTQGENDANEVTDLGATITPQGVSFKLWAPTAQQVELLVFNDDLSPASTAKLAMEEDNTTGVWSVVGDKALNGAYYQYQITVYHPITQQVETLVTTDPYSLSLSVNSKYSQVVDLNSADTQPSNWQQHNIPSISNVEDHVLYETHIRDFSSDDTALSDSRYKGKYKAFSEQNSYGMKHLLSLRDAGLNTVHLLPTFDIGTVNEDIRQAISLDDSIEKVCAIAPNTSVCSDQKVSSQTSLKTVLESFDVSGSQAQQLVSELREVDNFNWGYDPFHYTVPEGSYALNPQGKARIVEFREMVQNLHELGFRVIMDVVYNHTYQSGLEDKSVLDKIVPHYYHRLHPVSGAIEQSTCCDNTATERVMMAKLMTDSLVVWARDYKIDGFRFDLMGHQPKQAMLVAREAVRQVDNDTYFYGEGWNFGEVANNSQFTQASQLELGGTEIGTFTDRLRDAVRGGGNNTRDSQGIGNGLLMQPNERADAKQSLADYHLRMDQLRIGLAGNLVNYPLENVQGEFVLGKEIPYGDQPTGYALDPADTINYVSKHDNQTLWDNSQYRLAFDVTTENRVRMHVQSLSFALFAQGIPFLHMGSEFMRSKSFLRDSYDYSDWFNRVDFSKQNNYYNVGLPPAVKDKENWPLIKEVMAGHQGRDQVTSEDIAFASKAFKDMLAIRMSSPLFRLTSEQQVLEKVAFLNQGKAQQLGLLVMQLDDSQGEAVDDNNQRIMVIFNTSDKAQFFAYESAASYQLHPIQQQGEDTLLKQSKATDKGFSVAPLSSVVFVEKR